MLKFFYVLKITGQKYKNLSSFTKTGKKCMQSCVCESVSSCFTRCLCLDEGDA